MEKIHWNISEQTRTYHYWRGFRAALFISVPIIVFLMVCVHYLIG